MFFLCGNFVASLIWTLKSKKPLKTFKKPLKTFKKPLKTLKNFKKPKKPKNVF